MTRNRIWAGLAVSLVAAILVGVGLTFPASNTVPDTKVGDGQGTITGYNVASVHYVLNTADRSKVDSVTFTLDSVPVAGSTIQVRVESGGSTWYTCTNSGASVTCATTSPQASASAANELRVVVAQ